MVNASKGVSLPRHRAHGLLRFCDNFQHSMVLRPFKTLPLAGVKATSFQNKNQRQKGLVSASKDVCASASKAFARESQPSGSSSAKKLWNMEMFVGPPSHLITEVPCCLTRWLTGLSAPSEEVPCCLKVLPYNVILSIDMQDST